MNKIKFEDIRQLEEWEIIREGDLWTELGMGYIEATEKYIGSIAGNTDDLCGAWFRPIDKN